jgi:hypothetical protein
MKTLLPVLALVVILSLSVASSILYLNMQYITSALLTIASIVGISLWIGARGMKENSK